MRAEGRLDEQDVRDLERVLEARRVKGKVIPFGTEEGFVVVKTTAEYSAMLREPENAIKVGGRTLKPWLTSGAIGKLKRAVSDARGEGIGQIHE